MNTLQVSTLAVLLFPAASLSLGQVFSEDFNSLDISAAITASNTNLTYARVGSGGGGIVAGTSSFSGMSAHVTGPNSTSLNGIGVSNTLPPSDVYTMAFDLKLENSVGSIVFGAGTGPTFTNNNTFNTGEGLFWFQLKNGSLQYRSGDNHWVDAGDWQLAEDVPYNLRVVANGSGNSLEYGGRALAAGSMDFYVNGSLAYDGVAVTNSLEADGFRLYSVSGANFEVDNIQLWNAPQAIPEPATYGFFFGAIALGGAAVWRRRVRP